MRRYYALLLFAAGLMSASAYAGNFVGDSRMLLAERQDRDIRVVMYMTSWCPYCRKAREYLNGLGVNIVEYDIEKDPSKKVEMKKLSGGSGLVPLIDIEGVIIQGYMPDEIRHAVEQKKKEKMSH